MKYCKIIGCKSVSSTISLFTWVEWLFLFVFVVEMLYNFVFFLSVFQIIQYRGKIGLLQLKPISSSTTLYSNTEYVLFILMKATLKKKAANILCSLDQYQRYLAKMQGNFLSLDFFGSWLQMLHIFINFTESSVNIRQTTTLIHYNNLIVRVTTQCKRLNKFYIRLVLWIMKLCEYFQC